MANWKYKLHLKDLKNQYEKNEITLQELCEKMAERITESPFYSEHPELEIITVNFLGSVDNEEDFDNILEELYDWGDTIVGEPRGLPSNRLCWIGFAI